MVNYLMATPRGDQNEVALKLLADVNWTWKGYKVLKTEQLVLPIKLRLEFTLKMLGDRPPRISWCEEPSLPRVRDATGRKK